MKKNKTRVLQGGLYLLFFVAFFAMFYFGLRDVLQGWEAHAPLFRYSKDYFEGYRYEPQSLLVLTNAFLVQFSYYPALGALIYAGLFTFLSYCVNLMATPKVTPSSVTTQISYKPVVIGFVVATTLLPSFSCLFFLWPLIFFSFVVGSLIWRATSENDFWHILARIVYLGIQVLYLREYIAIAMVIYILIDVFYPTSYIQRIKNILITVFFAIVYSCLFSYIWKPYDFYGVREYAFGLLGFTATGIFPIPFWYFDVSRTAMFCLYVGLLFCVVITMKPIVQKLFSRKRLRIALGIVFVLFSVFFMGISPWMARTQAIFFKADTLQREQRWKEALKVLNREYERNSREKRLEKSSVLYDTQVKTSLLAMNKATDQIFTYDLLTFPLLFPDNINNRPEAYILPSYYFYCGNYSENLHINYDFVTSRCTSPVLLKAIIETSLVMDDTMSASKFVNMTRQSLFHGKEAVSIFQGNDPKSAFRVKRGKRLYPIKNYAVDAYKPDLNQVKSCFLQPQNIYFYEYFLIRSLLYKDAYVIAQQFDQIKKFYPRGVPRHLQEGYLASYEYMPSRLFYPSKIDGIDKETWDDYWRFVWDDQAYQIKKIPFDEFERKWRHTFWFYQLYMVRDDKKIQ